MQYGNIDYRGILRIFLRSFSYLTHRGRYWIGNVLALSRLATSFLIPYLYQTLIDGMQTEIPFRSLSQELLIPFILLLLIAPLYCLGTYWRNCAAIEAGANMQKDVNAHVVDMPVLSLETDRADKLLRATVNAQATSTLLSGRLLQMAFNFIVFTGGALILLLITDYRYAVMGVSFCGAMFGLSTFLNSRLRSLESMALDADSTAAKHLLETICNLPIVKIYRLESRLEDDYRSAGMYAYEKRVIHMRLRGVLDGSMDLLYFGIQPLAIIIGITAMERTGMNFAQPVYIASLLSVMLNGMRELGFFIQFVQKAVVNAERTYSLLDTPAESDHELTAKWDTDSDVAVEFRRVSFDYAEGSPTLRNIDLRIKKGAHVAIVGPSGCGKSTLLKLLLRLYESGSGDILLFDAPIRQLNNTALRKMSAYIPQDCGLFDGTVKENITLGNPGRTEAQVIQAMKDAALYDYVQSLPKKEDTVIGEGGSLLSGGQGQRIAIARALLKDAPLILLDEATSALDVNTEHEIHTALSRVAAEKTILCVTHRLSTVVDFDMIVFMAGGQIKEIGSHEELLARKGAYCNMYNTMAQSAPPH